MSDSDDMQSDEGEYFDESELGNEEGLDVLEDGENEDDVIIDLKFNNRSEFDDFSKVMDLTENNIGKKELDKKKITQPKLTKYEKTKNIRNSCSAIIFWHETFN